MARKYHEKACKRSVMRKKKVVMISVGHRRKKMQVKVVKIGPLIDNMIMIIIIIIIIIIQNFIHRFLKKIDYLQIQE